MHGYLRIIIMDSAYINNSDWINQSPLVTFANILPPKRLSYVHSPTFYPSKIFPHMVSLSIKNSLTHLYNTVGWLIFEDKIFWGFHRYSKIYLPWKFSFKIFNRIIQVLVIENSTLEVFKWKVKLLYYWSLNGSLSTVRGGIVAINKNVQHVMEAKEDAENTV